MRCVEIRVRGRPRLAFLRSSPRSPRAACVLRGSLLLLRVFVQPRALHGLLAAEQRDLLQRRVELVRLALEVVQRVDVHVHHLDELRQPGRLLAARLGLPLRVELLDALGELLARLAQPAPRKWRVRVWVWVWVGGWGWTGCRSGGAARAVCAGAGADFAGVAAAAGLRVRGCGEGGGVRGGAHSASRCSASW